MILIRLSNNISGTKRNSLGKTPDPGGPLHRSYVPLESGRNVFAQPSMPRTAMEQSGHAQVPTLLVALVRRQAGRAGWTAEIGYKNTEE